MLAYSGSWPIIHHFKGAKNKVFSFLLITQEMIARSTGQSTAHGLQTAGTQLRAEAQSAENSQTTLNPAH